MLGMHNCKNPNMYSKLMAQRRAGYCLDMKPFFLIRNSANEQCYQSGLTPNLGDKQS